MFRAFIHHVVQMMYVRQLEKKIVQHVAIKEDSTPYRATKIGFGCKL